MAKLGIIVVAVVVLFDIKRRVYGAGAPGVVTPPVRALAAASLALWLAAIVTGRYMAYV
jgi:hypothetical protein